MVLYICEICKKNFNKKSNYVNHVENKKKPCGPKIIIIDNTTKIPQNIINDIVIEQKIPQNTTNIVNNIENEANNIEILTPIKKKYMCNYCSREFTRSDHLKTHLTSRCKIRKEENKEKEEIFKNLLKKYEEMDEKMRLFQKEQEEKDNKINILEIELENLKSIKDVKKSKNINISKTTNTNNGTINGQNNGTINNTINIIQHGKEDLSKIENSVFVNALLKFSGAKIPEKLIEGIHFNEKYPEFNNIYISDINREKVMMHNGKEWVLTNDDVTSNLLDKSIIFSETKYEQLEDKIKQPAKKKIDKELKMLALMKEFDELTEVNEDDDGNPLTKKEISRRHYLRNKAIGYLKLLLYNSRNIIINSLK